MAGEKGVHCVECSSHRPTSGS